MSAAVPKSEAQTQNRFSLPRVGCCGSGNGSPGNIETQLSSAEEFPGPSRAPQRATSFATHSTTGSATATNKPRAASSGARRTPRTSTTRATSTRKVAT